MKYAAIYRVDMDNILFLRLDGGFRNMCFVIHILCFITNYYKWQGEKIKLRRGERKGREETDVMYVYVKL